MLELLEKIMPNILDKPDTLYEDPRKHLNKRAT